MRRSWFLVLAAAAALPAFGQGPPPPGPGGPHEVFKMIDAYLLANVQDALGLGDEQGAKVVPLVLKLQGDRRNFHRRRHKALGEMKKQLGSGTATEAQIADQMKALRALEGEELDTLRKDLEAVDKELTVVQQAKFRILEREVEHKIQTLITEYRERRVSERGPQADRRGRTRRERGEKPEGAEDSAPRP
jgi:hypothetical protein